MGSSVRLHLNAALATHVCMEDIAKILVQVSTVLVLMIMLVLVASMNMTHVRQWHAAMGLPALIMVQDTLAYAHMVTLVSLQILFLIVYHQYYKCSCSNIG